MKRQSTKSTILHPLLSPKERLAVWESIRGIWKNRKPDPVEELKKMRSERERDILSHE